MCATTQNRKKISKTLCFLGSTSFEIIDVKTPKSLSLVPVMLSSKSLSLYNRFYAKRDNGGKITFCFLGGRPTYLSLTLSFEWNSHPAARHFVTRN